MEVWPPPPPAVFQGQTTWNYCGINFAAEKWLNWGGKMALTGNVVGESGMVLGLFGNAGIRTIGLPNSREGETINASCEQKKFLDIQRRGERRTYLSATAGAPSRPTDCDTSAQLT